MIDLIPYFAGLITMLFSIGFVLILKSVRPKK